MGDIADYYLERYPEDCDDEDAPPPRCKFCGSKAVTWIHTGERWRLFDTAGSGLTPHSCRPNVTASLDDFEDCSK